VASVGACSRSDGARLVTAQVFGLLSGERFAVFHAWLTVPGRRGCLFLLGTCLDYHSSWFSVWFKALSDQLLTSKNQHDSSDEDIIRALEESKRTATCVPRNPSDASRGSEDPELQAALALSRTEASERAKIHRSLHASGRFHDGKGSSRNDPIYLPDSSLGCDDTALQAVVALSRVEAASRHHPSHLTGTSALSESASRGGPSNDDPELQAVLALSIAESSQQSRLSATARDPDDDLQTALQASLIETSGTTVHASYDDDDALSYALALSLSPPA
jgi:hypothetical protein